MKLDLNIKGIDKVREQLAKLTGPQARAGYAKALNDTAFQHLRPAMQQQMQTNFNAPTPWVVKSPKVFPATPEKLEATIAPTYWSQLGTKGGKAGVDPQQVLLAQTYGGQRRDKRSEVALRRIGILPNGYQTALPGTPFPGSQDAYGNVRGAFMQQLLSYFQAFSEQGSKANMTDRTRANLARGGTKAKLAKVAGPTLGRRYFVSYGKMRGGARTTARGEADRRASNLPPGIWAVLGSSGAVVRPVLMFVRKGTYRPRVDLDALAKSPATSEHLARRLRYRIREAAGV